ncbi:MAG TPA: R3H domain-containing nucleic acid-binding protein [Candidatus Paceibacterota bacterium]|nr:R3H domain-containing nucleic acid-binding protein [Candidatus Paceibacterota bacterium]
MEPAIEAIIKELLDATGIPYSKVARSELAGQVIFSIETSDGGHSILGAHHDTLQALDLLVKKIVEKRMPPRDALSEDSTDNGMFIIDVNDHRTKQIRDLQTKAIMMAERARSFQYDVELTPMSAYERLIIHTTLQDAPNVKTESQGEGRNRRVVIKYSA